MLDPIPNILDSLRALDVTNGAAVGAFLRNAKTTYEGIAKKAYDNNPGKYTGYDHTSLIYATNIDDMFASRAFILQTDFDKLESLFRITGKSSRYNNKVATIDAIFKYYTQQIDKTFDETLKALNCFEDDFIEEKQNIEQLKTLYKQKNISNIEEINELFITLDTKTLEALTIKVDQLIADKLTPAPPTSRSASNNDIEMTDLTPEILKASTDTNLNKLSHLANQLVEDAERRKKTHPEERIVAARLRLSINKQRMNRDNPEKFLKKLKPQLETANACFSRHRNNDAIRKLDAIRKVVTEMSKNFILVIRGKANKDTLSYKSTIRLFKQHYHKKPLANTTVQAMEKAAAYNR